MNRLTIIAWLQLVVLAAPAWAQPRTVEPPTRALGGASGPVFRSGVDLITLTVTVADAHQRYVAGLGKEDFALYEDGVQQDLAFFAADRVPLDMAILLDTSSSMSPRMPVVHEAAVGFARTLQEGDRGTVIEFADAVRVRQALTGDLSLLEPAVLQTAARGGTALYTALYVAVKELARDRAKNGEVRRQAIVVLSDGADTRSLVAFDDVRELARRSGIGIYAISIGDEYTDSKRQSRSAARYFSPSDFMMRSLADETGGRWFAPIAPKQLASTYAAVAEELANQYSLGYVSRTSARKGAFRRVLVRLPSRPDARPRTRTGYVAPGGSETGSH